MSAENVIATGDQRNHASEQESDMTIPILVQYESSDSADESATESDSDNEEADEHKMGAHFSFVAVKNGNQPLGRISRWLLSC